jgi:hypothetical protein
MRCLIVHYPQDQITSENILVSVLQIPSEEGGLLAAISEGQHLPSGLWEFLVKGRRDHGVRAVSAVDDLAHRVAGLVAANRTLRDLIFLLLRLFLFQEIDRGSMPAAEFFGCSTNLPTLTA